MVVVVEFLHILIITYSSPMNASVTLFSNSTLNIRQAMVQASCEMKASPYEAEEMEFLSTLCEKIRQDNSIILLYIQVMM